jgi:arylsulfatase A-like enzyme
MGLSRRRFLAGAGVLAGAGALGACSSGREPAEPRRSRPNVLYVTVDDLGTTLGVYGDAQVHSPNIDAFASQSLLFDRAYCQIANCSPSRTSILTGLRPETTGLIPQEHDWQAALPGARSLPRVFRDDGYRTVSVGKIFDDRGGGPDDCWDERFEPGGVADSSLAIEQLSSLAAGPDPFLLAVGYSQPHCPWDPTPDSMSEYDPAAVELLGPGRTFDPEMQECAGASAPTVSDDEAREITARYFGEVTDADAAFGALLGELERLDLADDTIVIFWSGDHGFHLGQNDWWGKWTCYDAATRVPLIMRVPGRTTAGSRAPGIVECVDMFPTLVELCDLPQPPQTLDGLSFVPLLEDPTRSWKHSAFSVFGAFDEIGQRSIKTPQYDFIRIEANLLRPESRHLYDLDADPTEATDLWTPDSHIAAVLEERLELGPSAALPTAPPITF